MTTRKIMASARNEACTVRLPGVCSFDPATTVFAHINGIRFGKGTAIKSKFGAYACYQCHSILDSGKRPEGMTKQDVLLAHYEAAFETLGKLIDKGLVILK
ncbi:MAG: nuclease domain-containing protein [Methylotenera sp.]